MVLRTLGELHLDGSLTARRPKPLLLVAYLAIEGARSREHVGTVFWPGATDRRNRLSVTLSRLRREAPGAVMADAEHVWTAVRCDALELKAAVERGDLNAAEALYRGAFVADVEFDLGSELEEWVFATREHLADSLRDALLERASALAERGDFERAARIASRATWIAGATSPTSATFRRAADLLAAGTEDRSGDWRRVAHREGIALPTPTGAAAARERLTAHVTTPTSPNNLPHSATSFVGRERELTGITELFDALGARLVTVLGPGGTGKTRLALEVARERARTPGFDGVYHVALGSLPVGSDASAALVSALGLPHSPSASALDALRSALGSQRVFLVLDELEHLADAARWVADVLAALPNALCLVTSRRRLDVEEEHVWQLGGLELPSADDHGADGAEASEAVQLFVHRAKRARADLTLGAGELGHVTRICRLVEGAPLALELAAVWVRSSTPSDIADAIAASLDALATPSRNIAPGHRSMRSVFDRSWSLLSEASRRATASLSVLPDGATVDLAVHVAEAGDAELAQLCDASLLRRDADGRYRQHTLLRQYAFDRLADDPGLMQATDRRLLAAARRLADEAEPNLHGPEQKRWFEALERELGMLRAALEAAERVAPEDGVHVAYALRTFWHVHSHLGWLSDRVERLVRLDDAIGPTARARAAYLIALPPPLTTVSRERNDRALALAREVGDDLLVAEVTQHAGWIAHAIGDGAVAETHHRDALERFRALRHTVGEAAALYRLGALAYFAGALDDAKRWFEASLALETELGNTWGIAVRHYNLGIIAKKSGAYTEALEAYRRSLRSSTDLGDRRQMGWVLEGLACLASVQGDALRAATLWGAVEVERRRAHRQRYGVELKDYVADVAEARAQVSADAFQAAWAHGERLGFDAVLEAELRAAP